MLRHFADRIERFAKLAGVDIQKAEDRFSIVLQLRGDRTQTIWIEPGEDLPGGSHIIEFSSICQKMASGLLSGLPKSQAIGLLRLNSRLAIGHYCLIKTGAEEVLAVRSTQIAETMDFEEFKLHCVTVAQLADTWEEKLGRDEF